MADDTEWNEAERIVLLNIGPFKELEGIDFPGKTDPRIIWLEAEICLLKRQVRKLETQIGKRRAAR